MLADGDPSAFMTDVVHPDLPLPDEAELRRAFDAGRMILDVLLERDVPIAFATTRVCPRLVTPGERAGRLFGLTRPTAALELEERIHVTSGEVVHHSRDLFAPEGVDLHVVRALELEAPVAVNAGAHRAGRAAPRAAALRPRPGPSARRSRRPARRFEASTPGGAFGHFPRLSRPRDRGRAGPARRWRTRRAGRAAPSGR